tara:strand:+ start:3062 stop:3364 length:303 start_codon:yes stop_codon:yes gene_type:complete
MKKTIELLRQLIREMDMAITKNVVDVRGHKGHGAGHVIKPRKPLMGLGKSAIEYQYPEEEPEEEEIVKNPVKVSKAFEADDADEYYKRIMERVKNAKKLY